MKRFETRSVSNFDCAPASLGKGRTLGIRELVRHLEAVKTKSTKGMALVIRISTLSLGTQHSSYKSLAISCIETFIKNCNRSGQIFTVSSGDLVLLCDKISPEEGRKLSVRIRSLFSEDVGPLSHEGEVPHFYELYDLDQQYEIFRLVLISNLAEQEISDLTSKDPSSWIKFNDGRTVPLDPENLKNIETALESASLKPLLHGQFICKRSNKGSFSPSARELYISIAELRRTLAPEVDLLSDQWLFRRLTCTLDRRILGMLSSKRSSNFLKESDISLNINLSSVLSEGFQVFDRSLSEEEKKQVTLEFNKADVFADMGAFLYARDWLKERGYRICLDGLTYMTLPFIDWQRLGFDCLKLFWSGELLDPDVTKRVQEAWNGIKGKTLGTSIILARCEEPAALVWGKTQGIDYFQGWHVDKYLMPGFQDSEGSL
ncbi:MAG: EAL domain-containing protein [bacterium]|nr:EAL domain-containing protein [bacterium]